MGAASGIQQWCRHMPSSREFACGPPPRLYHYTDLQAAAAILASKSLRLTKVEYLNDLSELEHGIGVFQEVADELTTGRARGHAHADFLRGFARALGASPRPNVCIASFCDEGDLLSQWRSYGGAGKGIALGFSGAVLARFSEGGFETWRCIYDPSVQRRVMHELIAHLLKRLDELRAHDEAGRAREALRRELSAVFLMVAPVMKHESFAEEREWRLISRPLAPTHPAYQVSISNLRVTEYFQLRFGATQDEAYDFLEELVVGPARDAVLILDAFKVLLDKHRISCGVCRASRIPYRPV
jgi:hypothetical protein